MAFKKIMLRLGSAAHRKSREIAKRLDKFRVRSFDMNLTDLRRGLTNLEKELLLLTKASRERGEIRRRVAELYLDASLERRAPWKAIRLALSTLDKAGYSDVDRRVHAAMLLGKYAADVRVAQAEAITRLNDALRRLKSLKRNNVYRQVYQPRLERQIAVLSSEEAL